MNIEEAALAFRTAAAKGDVLQLKKLLKEYKSPLLNAKGAASQKTALHRAMENNQHEVVRYLLQCGIDPNLPDKEGNTPIMLGALKNSLEAMHQMLEYKGLLDILHKNNAGQNVMMLVISVSKLRVLKELIKKKLIEQVQDMQAQGFNITTVDMQKDGDIKLLSLNTEECFDKVTSSLNVTIRRGQEDIRIKNSKGKTLDVATSEKYTLPPLVFFMNHQDNATFELIQNNFQFLKSAGYKSICLECDANIGLDELISSFKNTVTEDSFSETGRKIARIHQQFFSRVREAKFDYHGVDLNMGDFRANESNAPFLKTDLVSQARDQAMAQNVHRLAKQYQGGIIVILGAAHAEFTAYLELLNHGRLEPFTFFGIYSQQDSIFKNLECELKFKSLLTNSKFIAFDYTKLSAETSDKLLRMPIEIHHVKENTLPIKTLAYDKTVETTLSQKLSEFHIGFSGAKRASDDAEDIIVDGVLGVCEPDHFYGIGLQLSKVDIPVTVAWTKYRNQLPQLSAVVEDINGGPSKEKIAALNV